METVMLEHS